MLENIEARLGLHAILEVLYVVDGYEANFLVDNVCIQVGHGKTLEEAIVALNSAFK